MIQLMKESGKNIFMDSGLLPKHRLPQCVMIIYNPPLPFPSRTVSSMALHNIPPTLPHVQDHESNIQQ